MHIASYLNLNSALRLLVQVSLILYGLVFSQTLSISQPEDKSVNPGDFVTLVFRLEASQDMLVSVRASSSWAIVRQPGEQKLSANKVKPLALTVQVPTDAKATHLEIVSLEVSNTALSQSAKVSLRVNEFHHLTVSVPDSLTIGQDQLSIEVHNKGNISEELRLTVKASAEEVLSQELKLEPFSQESILFQPQQEGLHVVELVQKDLVLATGFVKVVRIGISEPEALILTGQGIASISSEPGFQGSLGVAGPLSDFAFFESRLLLANWQTSFAELRTESFTARIGSAEARPFRLNLRGGFGLSGQWRPPYQQNTHLAASFSWLEKDQFAGYLAGQYKDETTVLAAGSGFYRGNLSSDLKLLIGFDQSKWQARANLLGDKLNVEGKVDVFNDFGNSSFELAAENLLLQEMLFRGAFRHKQETSEFFGGLSLGLHELVWDAHLGSQIRLSESSLNPMQLGLQFGLSHSYITFQQSSFIAETWQTTNRFSLSLDPGGFALSLDSSWLELAERLSFNANLYYRPQDGFFDTQLRALGKLELSNWPLLKAELGWGLASQSLSFSNTLDYQLSDWQLSLSNKLAYDYGAPGGWRYGLSLQATYDFVLPVAESVIDTMGGRNLGQLLIKVSAEGEAVSGVTVNVGRYRFLSDDTGSIAAFLSPGDYEVKLESSSLPSNYYLLSEADTRVSISLGSISELSFETSFASSIEGQVLEDDDADGLANPNARGVEASLLLTDSQGFKRQISTDSQGRFFVSRLKPGDFSLKLITIPQGASIVGNAEAVFSTRAKEKTQLSFLVQPASAKGQSFSSSKLRIRNVSLEVDTLPPGSSPLVKVELSSPADSLMLISDFGSFAFEMQDDSWLGRFPIPLGTATGVVSANLVAKRGDEAVSKAIKVFVDTNAPGHKLELNSPVRPGSSLLVDLQSWLYPLTLSLDSDFGASEFSPLSPGKYQARLAIPEDASDAVYSLKIILEAPGQNITITETFRVLVTD